MKPIKLKVTKGGSIHLPRLIRDNADWDDDVDEVIVFIGDDNDIVLKKVVKNDERQHIVKNESSLQSHNIPNF